MKCKNCNNENAVDLVFCTECGARLHEPLSPEPTGYKNDPVTTKVSEPAAKPKSKLIWLVIAAVLIAIPLSIFGIYLLLNLQKQPPAQNLNQAKNTKTTPAVKTNSAPANNNSAPANQESSANTENSNLNATNSNANQSNSDSTSSENEFWNERRTVDPDSTIAISFIVENESSIIGQVNILKGSKIEGFVCTQKQYDDDNLGLDDLKRIVNIEGEKKVEVNQKLKKGNYVLVFHNSSETPIVLEGQFKIEK